MVKNTRRDVQTTYQVIIDFNDKEVSIKRDGLNRCEKPGKCVLVKFVIISLSHALIFQGKLALAPDTTY